MDNSLNSEDESEAVGSSRGGSGPTASGVVQSVSADSQDIRIEKEEPNLFEEKSRIERLSRIRQIMFGSLDGLLVPLGVISGALSE